MTWVIDLRTLDSDFLINLQWVSSDESWLLTGIIPMPLSENKWKKGPVKGRLMTKVGLHTLAFFMCLFTEQTKAIPVLIFYIYCKCVRQGQHFLAKDTLGGHWTGSLLTYLALNSEELSWGQACFVWFWMSSRRGFLPAANLILSFISVMQSKVFPPSLGTRRRSISCWSFPLLSPPTRPTETSFLPLFSFGKQSIDGFWSLSVFWRGVTSNARIFFATFPPLRHRLL